MSWHDEETSMIILIAVGITVLGSLVVSALLAGCKEIDENGDQ